MEVRQVFDNKEDAIRWETRVLTRLGVLGRSDWLNRNIGGAIKNDVHPRLGVRLSIETKRKIGDANRGRQRTLKSRLLMSEKRRGCRHWNYGRTWTSNTIERNRESNRQTFQRLSHDPEWMRRKQQTTRCCWWYLENKETGEIFKVASLRKFAKRYNLVVSNLITRRQSKMWRVLKQDRQLNKEELALLNESGLLCYPIISLNSCSISGSAGL